MKRSEQINDLAAALAAAQGQMGGALKASDNPFFKSRYADLASVWQACRKPLADNGLAVIQTVRVEYDNVNPDVAALANAVSEKVRPPAVVVTTLLAHHSGQFIEESLTMWPRENSPQAIGSCTSYARRYSLAAMVGVYQQDDDAESAEGRKTYGDDSGADEAVAGLQDVVKAVALGDAPLLRTLWNEQNVVGNAAHIWKLLNTKQKKAARDLLQQTDPRQPTTEATPAVETGGPDEP